MRSSTNQDIRITNTFDFKRGFHWQAYYRSENHFEHGGGEMNFELERGVFSPWRITAWTLSHGRVDSPVSTPSM